MPLVGQQLAAFLELFPFAFGGVAHLLFDGAEFLHRLQQGVTVLPVFLAVRVEGGFEYRH